MALENAREMEKDEFVREMLSLLPAIYLDFSSIDVEELPEQSEFEYFASYVDEDFYESVRRNVETLMGPDDVFLETFEEDMKYSDTPIAASVAECLADIFQPLYNFISVMRDSDGESAPGAPSIPSSLLRPAPTVRATTTSCSPAPAASVSV